MLTLGIRAYFAITPKLFLRSGIEILYLEIKEFTILKYTGPLLYTKIFFYKYIAILWIFILKDKILSHICLLFFFNHKGLRRD
jgi:hypothetical protein